MRVLLTVFLALVCCFGTAVAADVTGTWTGKLATPHGDFNLKFVFQQDGAKLTGTGLGMQGEAIPIKEGKVDGDQITFMMEIDVDGVMKIPYSGKLSGDTMNLQVTVPDQEPMLTTLVRAK